MSQTLTEWSEDEFNTAMKNDRVSVVEFGATWCASCKATEPILAEMVNDFSDVTFAKIDVAKNAPLASRMGVMSLPNIIIMTKGKVVEQIIGGANRAKIEEKLKKAL